jgi:beta-N-acetylhexosaminidase
MVCTYVPQDVEILRFMCRKGQLGGLVLGPGELSGPDAAIRLVAHVQSLSPLPLVIACESEAGVGQRMAAGATELPPHMAIGATGSAACARACGEVTGREAVAIGAPCVLAPVLDLAGGAGAIAASARAFGESPGPVSEMGAAFAEGIAAGGGIAVGKHFPGIGNGSFGAQGEKLVVARDRAQLESADLQPFRAAIHADIPALLCAHARFPALDPDPVRTAATSYAILTDLLRHQMGFRGVSVADASPVARAEGDLDAAEADIMAAQAGADLVLTTDPRRTFHALLGAARTEQIATEAVFAAAGRVVRLKRERGLLDRRALDPESATAALGAAGDLAMVRDVARAAITLVRNAATLPIALPLSGEAVIAAVGVNGRRGTEAAELLAAEVAKRHGATALLTAAAGHDEVVRRARSAAFLLVGDFAPAGPGAEDVALVHALQALERPMAVVSFGDPHVARHFTRVPAYLCAYGACPALVEATVEVLFGEINPAGRLPVTIPGFAAVGTGLRY